MDFRMIILSIVLGASALIASFAQAQSSRQVSAAPAMLEKGATVRIAAPLTSLSQIFEDVVATLSPEAADLTSTEKLELLEQADPYFLLGAAAEKSVLKTYDQALSEGNLFRTIGALAYLTGLANPLYGLEVTAHNRLPVLFPQSDIRRETYTLAYKLHRGFMRWCQTTILKSHSTGELLDINFAGCEHFIDQLP